MKFGARLPGASVPEFAPGEAEEMVKQIRREFHAAESKRGSDDDSGGDRAERKANGLLEKLRRRIEHYLDRQIQRQIPFASSGEKEDAIVQLQYGVLVRVKDTRPSPSAEHWERRFNQCVQRRAVDICRPIQKRHGYKGAEDCATGNDPVCGPREIPFSVLDATSDAGGAECRFVDRLPDDRAEREIEAVLGTEMLRQLVATLGPNERGSLLLWWRQDAGETWETIGALEGLRPDAARKRAQSVLRTLRKIAEE